MRFHGCAGWRWCAPAPHRRPRHHLPGGRRDWSPTYLDGRCRAEEHELFEAHLSECEDCTEHVQQIRATVALTGPVRDEDLDPLAREDLVTCIAAGAPISMPSQVGHRTRLLRTSTALRYAPWRMLLLACVSWGLSTALSKIALRQLTVDGSVRHRDPRRRSPVRALALARGARPGRPDPVLLLLGILEPGSDVLALRHRGAAYVGLARRLAARPRYTRHAAALGRLPARADRWRCSWR